MAPPSSRSATDHEAPALNGAVRLALALGLAACGSSTAAPDATPAPDAEPPGSDCNPDLGCRRLAGEFPTRPTRDVDVLFVVDDSSGMDDAQLYLAAAFAEWSAVLGAFPGGLPNLHLGVVSSDLGIDPF